MICGCRWVAPVALRRIVEVLSAEPEMSKNALGAALREVNVKAGNQAISDAVALMIHRGDVDDKPGARGSILISLAQTSAA
jgi:hypothetical protein